MPESEWLRIFGRNLCELIQEHGYSQNEFAECVGISKSMISSYINGMHMPSVKALVNIAYELGISFDDLMDFGDRIR